MKLTNFKTLPAALITGTLALAACGGGNGNNRLTAPAPTTAAPGPFSFRTEAATMYTRVDRTGEPATATAFLSRTAGARNASSPTRSERDDFNFGDPAGDGSFATPIVASLKHIAAQLDAQLRSFGLVPCATGSGTAIDVSLCLAQAAGVLLPDVITLDKTAPAGWPNGRHPDDPVVDRLLAAGLLDISSAANAAKPLNQRQSINTLASLPLNPPGNDANTGDRSPTEFPYFRPPHTGP